MFMPHLWHLPGSNVYLISFMGGLTDTAKIAQVKSQPEFFLVETTRHIS